MNHLIFSAVFKAFLVIGGHQYTQQHGPFNNPSGKYYYKEPAQLNSSERYSWPTLVLPHSIQSIAIYTCIYYNTPPIVGFLQYDYVVEVDNSPFPNVSLEDFIHKDLRPPQGVKKVINKGQWIPVLNFDFVKCSPNEPLFYCFIQGAVFLDVSCVNSLPPLALDRSIFPRRTKKGPKTPSKPLHLLNDLDHTVDERFVLAYPVESLPLVAPSWEETLVNLDYLLAWCRPFLKTIRATQSGVATLTLDDPVDPKNVWHLFQPIRFDFGNWSKTLQSP
ncbi:hypothetical protein DSO57_1000154 [Entomophthora muscae]|uniref:Uncharacterized protein n=1 Tax=Entomophthora muscae TaxID=34485 RepID=A0ACC2T921_9FUNG|nr:hypothetical protein DSO57_1000154 [Entomophthora muscae]